MPSNWTVYMAVVSYKGSQSRWLWICRLLTSTDCRILAIGSKSLHNSWIIKTFFLYSRWSSVYDERPTWWVLINHQATYSFSSWNNRLKLTLNCYKHNASTSTKRRRKKGASIYINSSHFNLISILIKNVFKKACDFEKLSNFCRLLHYFPRQKKSESIFFKLGRKLIYSYNTKAYYIFLWKFSNESLLSLSLGRFRNSCAQHRRLKAFIRLFIQIPKEEKYISNLLKNSVWIFPFVFTLSQSTDWD